MSVIQVRMAMIGTTLIDRYRIDAELGRGGDGGRLPWA